jgi:isopentenyl-diphosphate delta-isomerase
MIQNRKEEHLRICLEENVEAHLVTSGFEKFRFIHQALPEIDRDEIDVSLTLFGKRLRAPILISPMTGGSEAGKKINRNLALAAQKVGVAMGVGSQRIALEFPELAPTFQIRDLAPDILLFANLGAVQLNYGYGVKECLKAVEMIEADGLIFHLNALQEACQPEGNRNFKGLTAKIGEVCRNLPVPVLVKECGWGISREVAQRLKDTGIQGIDVAGAGGTSWFFIENYRAKAKKKAYLSDSFREWGISTVESLLWVREVAPHLILIASGGVRTGLDIAKAISLGATMAGLALPMLKAATQSADAVAEKLTILIEELKTAMFCIGASTLEELRNTPYLRRVKEDV